MDTWQQYTLRANTEFRLACYGNAILMHNQALDHARHAFREEPRCRVLPCSPAPLTVVAHATEDA